MWRLFSRSTAYQIPRSILARAGRGGVRTGRKWAFSLNAGRIGPTGLGSRCAACSRLMTIEVEGLDAIDGTPVLDIKPYMAGFAPKGAVRQPAWAGELMINYWNKGA